MTPLHDELSVLAELDPEAGFRAHTAAMEEFKRLAWQHKDAVIAALEAQAWRDTLLPEGVSWPDFALRLRQAMAQANLSLRQTQAVTGVDQATIHRIAKNEKPVRVEAFLALSRFCDQHLPPPPSYRDEDELGDGSDYGITPLPSPPEGETE